MQRRIASLAGHALFGLFLATIAGVACAGTADGADAVMTTLAAGNEIPRFEGTDQTGRTQSFKTLTGANGLLLLFVRSADW